MTCQTNGLTSSKDYGNKYVTEISQPDDKDFTADQLPNKELILSSVQTSVTIGEESGTTAIGGRHHSDGRYHSAKKTPFKFIKNGKIVDEHLHPFFQNEILVASGIFSKDRYLFLIRKLRI